MYTQCPECATAFRVTAEILRQAAGKVRCGGCSNAFNALLYLSETRPEKPTRPSDEKMAVPELRPEDASHGIPGEQPPPDALWRDESQALLETLDELSGKNIRLEDTGIEWRLLPEEEDEARRTGAPIDADITGDTGEARVDELLEESPTPIDEYLTASPHDLDAPEVFEGGGDTPADSVEASEVFENAAGQMRFDDNTGLPDDFDLDADDVPGRPVPAPRAEAEPPTAGTQSDGLKIDIRFGAPEEWEKLLDEVDDHKPPAGAGDRKAEHDALDRSSDVGIDSGLTAASSDGQQPLDLDTQFGLQAEALGIGSPAGDGHDVGRATEARATLDTSALETSNDDGGYSPGAGNDEDGDEASILQMLYRDHDDDDVRINEDFVTRGDEYTHADIEENLYTADLDFALDDADLKLADSADDAPANARADLERTGNDDDGDAQESLDESLEALLEPDFNDIEADAEAMPSAIHDLELELGGEQAADDDDFDLVAGDDREPPTILPMSEEEQTINQMIDEDMLRIAVEEDDGLSSSMVLKAEDVESALAEGAREAAAEEKDEESSTGVGVETIIMEGEFIRTAIEEEALREQASEEQELADQEPKEHRLVTALKNTMHGRSQESNAPARTRRRHGLVAGVGVLTLLLVAQLIHQTRAELATIPALNGIIAPIYRTLGAPITPDWNVTGWRFEVTRGSTNARALADELAEDGRGIDFGAAGEASPEILTIYSRVGNQAEKALPYPLVSVSLTDRFDEIIGSKVLSPNEYLTGDFDPRRFVPPGETFSAVITIESPAAAATGFKLNVCYREAGGKLRCAIEDFL